MKTITTYVSLFLFVTVCQAQTPVGYFYDVDYNPIEGYMDDLTYSPKTSLNLTHNSDSFEEGSYYSLSGERTDGLIKFQNKKFWYKANKASKQEKIRPAEVQSIMVGIDSFFVTKNFNMEGSLGPILKTKPEPVQYITTVGNHIFAKHFNFTSGIGRSYGAAAITETFLVKENGKELWTSFSHNKNLFKKTALKYFGHIPYLKTQIEEGDLNDDDMMTLIKTSEYFTKYQNKEDLMFDIYWQETSDASRMEYTAKITNVEDSIWTLNYYQMGTLLAEAQYSSFYPYIKNGTFEWYYPNATTRKSVIYKNDELKEVKLYAENTQLLQHYRLIKNEVEDINVVEFISYNDNNGNALLDDQGAGTVIVEDKIFGREIVKEIEHFKVQKSYINKGSEKVYQLTDSRLKFKFKTLLKSFNMHFTEPKLDEAAADNAQGVAFLYLEIGPKGYATNYKILNEIHPQVDKKIESYVRNNIGEGAGFRQGFKPIKINKQKVAYELVIPITFGINRFYRKTYTPYYDPFWMNQHMMFNQPLNVTPPTFPSFN